ncbi:hypothetical protein UFOVP160_20 [uncultured Caudovirales phage]|uniref:C1q domain-containing protein n=1 Tax=uncultured Caudovirales phage TaxID=2100421 RepID=A0A6J7W9P6_9CAUD|nr:hypothetical protein UFOVP160_20 [uncultured Caudovirales phage]
MAITINGTGTITGISAGGLPSATVTQATLATPVAGTGPAFSAYLNSSQSVTSTVATKITLNAEEYDTNSNFDSTTNYRFTPTVAGYYQISGGVYASTATTNSTVWIYKNGSAYKLATFPTVNSSAVISSLIYFNGSTDYVELYAAFTGTTPGLQAGLIYTFFNGALVRSA